MRTHLYFLFLVSVLVYSSCDIRRELPEEAMGLAPVYLEVSADEVVSESPRSFGSLGKIVVVDTFIFVNERFFGIHVVDNSDPVNPFNVAFWNIHGNLDFTISDNFLYADSGADLLTIDISDIHDIQLLSVTPDIYQRPQNAGLFPQDYLGFFECVDTSLGYVLDWEEKLLIEPKCWR